jgi:hypothetical protein
MLASLIEVWTSAIWRAIELLISSVGNSISFKNLLATSIRAFFGHSWNQSIEVQLIIPGNFLALNLKASPTGEKHRAKCKFFLTLFKKKSNKTSGVSVKPALLA